MKKDERCKYYSGPVHNKCCKAGVNYRLTVGGPDLGWMARLKRRNRVKIIKVGCHSVIIDSCVYEFLSEFKWHVVKSKMSYYAYTHGRLVPSERGGNIILMHRLLTGYPSLAIDHKNRNGLDNRISNLRLANPSQNLINRMSHNKFGYRGVSKDPTSKRYASKIKYLRKQYFLGTSPTPKLAAIAYDKKAKELHGEFAITNF